MMIEEQISAEELHQSPLFQGIAPADVDLFLGRCEKKTLSQWAKVFVSGDTNRSLYLLASGTVELMLDGMGDQPSVLAELRAGGVFGEACFFHAAPHHSTAVCTSNAVVFELTRAKFDEMLANNCQIALRIGTNAAAILAERLHTLDEWVQSFLSGHHQDDWHTHLTAFRSHLTHPRTSTTVKPGFAAGGVVNSL